MASSGFLTVGPLLYTHTHRHTEMSSFKCFLLHEDFIDYSLEELVVLCTLTGICSFCIFEITLFVYEMFHMQEHLVVVVLLVILCCLTSV